MTNISNSQYYDHIEQDQPASFFEELDWHFKCKEFEDSSSTHVVYVHGSSTDFPAAQHAFSLLDATTDSSSSFDFSEFLTLPQSPSQTSLPEPQWPGPQQAARSPSPTVSSSASPSSSIDLRFVYCGACQTTLNNVEPTMTHTAKHRSPSFPFWPCVLSDCGKNFKYKKDLRRHLGDQHFDKTYICSCGPRRRRRDKHKTHINNCRHMSSGSYICQCGDTINGKDPRALEKHLRHIEKECLDWQPQKRGRPPKSDKKSEQRRRTAGFH